MPAAARRYDLDWLRVIAFAILIFHHVGMVYVTWGWHVKSVHAGPAADWLMSIVNPWRLSLLFFISGVALRFAADKTPTRAFLTSRTLRLGVPLLASMLVIVAPQSWLQLVESGEFEGGFLAFYPRYLDPTSDFSIFTPTYNHLWHVLYLLGFTLALVLFARPIAAFMAGAGAAATQRLFSGPLGPVWALAPPLVPLIAIRIWLTPHFPETHEFRGDWATHARSFAMALIGFVLAKDEVVWRALRRAGPAALTLAVVLITALSGVWLRWDARVAQDHWIVWPARLARIAHVWLAIAGLCWLAKTFLNRPSPALTYRTEAIFPWYILHQTLIILAGFWLTRQGLGAGTDFALVTLATFAGCLAPHEDFIRRSGVLRPLFGLKPATRAARPGAIPA